MINNINTELSRVRNLQLDDTVSDDGFWRDVDRYISVIINILLPFVIHGHLQRDKRHKTEEFVLGMSFSCDAAGRTGHVGVMIG